MHFESLPKKSLETRPEGSCSPATSESKPERASIENRSADAFERPLGAQNVVTFSTLTNMPCPVRPLVNLVPASDASIVQPWAS